MAGLFNFLAPAKQGISSFLNFADSGSPMSSDMEEWMQNYIIKKIIETGKYSGGIDYDVYGTGDGRGNWKQFFPEEGMFSPRSGWSNTLGRADWSVDPKTGDVTWKGSDYNFKPNMNWVFDTINKGGLFGDKTQKYAPKLNIYKSQYDMGKERLNPTAPRKPVPKIIPKVDSNSKLTADDLLNKAQYEAELAKNPNFNGGLAWTGPNGA